MSQIIPVIDFNLSESKGQILLKKKPETDSQGYANSIYYWSDAVTDLGVPGHLLSGISVKGEHN